MIAMKKSEMKLSAGMLVLAAATLLADAAPAQQVGTAAAVNPAAQARGTGGSRTIVLGQSIAHRERIQTTAAGSVQLLFLDKTSMTIGPNSDLAIDEYVYDPITNTGKMAATLTKGLMRFVGGQISHAGNAQVATPNAVVGIRGGVAIIGTQQVFVGYGEGNVTSGSNSVTLSAGEYTQTQGGGVPPTAPAPPPPALIASLVATFQSQGGQGGGAAASQGRVDTARTTATGSSTGTIATTSTAAANVSGQQTGQTANQTSTTQQLTQITQSTQTVQQQTIAVETVTEIRAEEARVVAEQERAVAEEVRRRQFAPTPFAFTTTRCCSVGNQTSPVPYLPPEFAQSGNIYVSPILGYRVGSVDNPNRAAFFQFGINITGTGANQNSWLFVNQGAFLDDGNGGQQSIAGFVGMRRGAANMFPGLATGANSSIPGSLTLDPDNIPSGGLTNQAYWVPETRQFTVPAAISNFDLGNGVNGTYNYEQQFSRITPPAGLGQNRPNEVLFGYAGGMVRTFNNTASQFTSQARPLFGVVGIGFDPSNSRLQANMSLSASETGTNGFQTADFQFGSLDTSQRARSAYVDYDNFAATANRVVTNTVTGEQAPAPGVQVNGQTPNHQAALFVNVPREVAQQVSAGLGGNITFCQCEYTRWGFWASHTNRTQNGATVTDRIHLGTWVAGRLPDVGDVPATGSATYVGHVVASIRNGGSEYVAGGNLSNTINFATRTGTASVAGLDGANYSGTLSTIGDPRFYQGTLSSSVGGRGMAMFGNLFRGTASPVGEMGGHAVITGTNYQGSGIFAGRMQ